MTALRLSLAIALLLAGSIAGAGENPCAQPENGASATTPLWTAVDPGGGIGGTGRADPGDGGIGGTGIVGTVTGFASICVNGLEVHYDAGTPVYENGRPSGPDRLAIGQQVAVDAATTDRGLVARAIELTHILEGPVTAADGENITVIGVPVRWAGDGEPFRAIHVAPGDWVLVDGWNTPDGTVRATRIAAVAAPGESGASAPRATLIRIPGLQLPADGGERLTVRGAWRDGRFIAGSIKPADGERWRPDVRRLVVETPLFRRGDTVETGNAPLDAAIRAAGVFGHGETPPAGAVIRATLSLDVDGRARITRIDRVDRDSAGERTNRGQSRRDGATAPASDSQASRESLREAGREVERESGRESLRESVRNSGRDSLREARPERPERGFDRDRPPPHRLPLRRETPERKDRPSPNGR